MHRCGGLFSPRSRQQRTVHYMEISPSLSAVTCRSRWSSLTSATVVLCSAAWPPDTEYMTLVLSCAEFSVCWRQRVWDYAVQWMKCVQSPAWKRDHKWERDCVCVCVCVCVCGLIYICSSVPFWALDFFWGGSEVISAGPRFTRFSWQLRIRILD